MLSVDYLDLPFENFIALKGEKSLLAGLRSLRIIRFALDRGVLGAILMKLPAISTRPLDYLQSLLLLAGGKVAGWSWEALPHPLVGLVGGGWRSCTPW